MSGRTQPRPPSSKGLPHTDAPDCADCETDLFVGAVEGTGDGWVCWCCGWRSSHDRRVEA
jgi:hypothetical protein